MNKKLSDYRISSIPRRKPMNMDDVDALPLEEQKAQRFVQDTRHRRTLVIWMMCVVSIWLLVVLSITIGNYRFSLRISNSVLITLLATTTLNVLGLLRIILNGLFEK